MTDIDPNDPFPETREGRGSMIAIVIAFCVVAAGILGFAIGVSVPW